MYACTYMYIYIYSNYLCIFPLPFYFNCHEISKKIPWNATVKLAIHTHSDKLSCK